MSGDVVSLNKARKAKARAQKVAQAAENRVKFGRTKEERLLQDRDAERRRRELDGARLEAAAPAAPDGGGDGTESR